MRLETGKRSMLSFFSRRTPLRRALSWRFPGRSCQRQGRPSAVIPRQSRRAPTRLLQSLPWVTRFHRRAQHHKSLQRCLAYAWQGVMYVALGPIANGRFFFLLVGGNVIEAAVCLLGRKERETEGERERDGEGTSAHQWRSFLATTLDFAA